MQPLPADTAPVRALGSGEGDRAAGPGLTIQIVALRSSAAGHPVCREAHSEEVAPTFL
jgi:hypothetical protein